jgi:ankyrin repeat protein
VVSRLLDAGADPARASVFTGGDSDEAALSALYFACMADNLAVARLLLERGVSTQDGESIYHAAQGGRLAALELLREFGADCSSTQSPYGNTPLFFLAGHQFEENGQAAWLKGFRWLLEHGADPNVPSDKAREVPLHAAARSTGLSRAIDLLFSHGADANIARADGRTPYAIAVRRGSPEIIAIFEAHGADEGTVSDVDRFIGACVRADEPEARRLLAAHPSFVRDLTDDDQRAVRFAIQDGSVAALELMRALGFDVMRRFDGATPLHEAAWLGRREVVKQYLAWGAPLNERDKTYGSSPLGWAAHGSTFAHGDTRDYASIVDLLAAAGADFDASVNKWDNEPASMASEAVIARLRAHNLTRDSRP